MVKATCCQKEIVANLKQRLAPDAWFFMVTGFCHGLVYHSVLVILQPNHEFDCLHDLRVVANAQSEVKSCLRVGMLYANAQDVFHCWILNQLLCSKELLNVKLSRTAVPYRRIEVDSEHSDCSTFIANE